MLKLMEEITGYETLFDNGARVELDNKYGKKVAILSEEITEHLKKMKCSRFYRCMFKGKSIIAIDNEHEVGEVRLEVEYCNPSSYDTSKKYGAYAGKPKHYALVRAIAYDMQGNFIKSANLHSSCEKTKEEALEDVREYLESKELGFVTSGTKEHNKKVFDLIYKNKKNTGKDTTRSSIGYNLINEFRNELAIQVMLKYKFITKRIYIAPNGEKVEYYAPTEIGIQRANIVG